MSDPQQAGAPASRPPAVMATRIAAAGFAIMMAVELAVYGKGLGRRCSSAPSRPW